MISLVVNVGYRACNDTIVSAGWDTIVDTNPEMYPAVNVTASCVIKDKSDFVFLRSVGDAEIDSDSESESDNNDEDDDDVVNR